MEADEWAYYKSFQGTVKEKHQDVFCKLFIFNRLDIMRLERESPHSRSGGRLLWDWRLV